MAVHPIDCTCDAYGCRLRRDVQINTGAASSNRRGTPGDNARYNGWERGYATEVRADGSRMPILNEHGDMMRMKEASQRSAEIDESRRRRQALVSTTHEGA